MPNSKHELLPEAKTRAASAEKLPGLFQCLPPLLHGPLSVQTHADPRRQIGQEVNRRSFPGYRRGRERIEIRGFVVDLAFHAAQSRVEDAQETVREISSAGIFRKNGRQVAAQTDARKFQPDALDPRSRSAVSAKFQPEPQIAAGTAENQAFPLAAIADKV